MSQVLSLSERFRPKTIDQFLGQERWLQKNGVIRRSIERGRPTNLLLWGPPGCGKTSLAGVYLSSFSCPHVDFHPTKFQASEVKRVLEEAAASPLLRPTLFWIDEIHRLTRPQQDLLLRAVEDGTIVVVAATTENPSFVLSGAFLSRMNVLTFAPLGEKDLMQLVHRVLDSHPHVTVDEEGKHLFIRWAVGDARKMLSLLEPLVEQAAPTSYDAKSIQQFLSHHVGGLTSEGEGRYFLISALHKAVRGSDCQAALYWLARLLTAGEDPLYVARRIVRMSVEDVGLADPQALSLALSALECYRSMGSPEGELALAEAVIYLALSPKSASAYVAFDKAKAAASATAHLLPPAHILNAPTSWMSQQGFGKGYEWDHDCPDAFSGQKYFPEGVEEKEYYVPVQRGFERELEKRLSYFTRLREARRQENPN
jgi:putative ATPase